VKEELRPLEPLLEEESYELQLTETALEAHRLGEEGTDEVGLDLESLDLALSTAWTPPGSWSAGSSS
jgi:hypothetical protein